MKPTHSAQRELQKMNQNPATGGCLTSRPLSHTTGLPSRRCLGAALARGSREPGQALTGAAISGVLLCEGRFWAVAQGVICYWSFVILPIATNDE